MVSFKEAKGRPFLCFMIRETNDKHEALRQKLNKLLEAKKLVCIEISLQNLQRSESAELFVAKRDDKGILQSPSLDELEEVTDVVDLFLQKELERQDLSIALSSPGLERKLKSREDFIYFVGRKIKITFESEDGKIKTAQAIISSSDEKKVELNLYFLNDKEIDNMREVLPYDRIKKASLL